MKKYKDGKKTVCTIENKKGLFLLTYFKGWSRMVIKCQTFEQADKLAKGFLEDYNLQQDGWR